MEALGGYATSSSSDEEDGISQPAAESHAAGGAELAGAAAEAARMQRVIAMEKSDSDDSDASDDSDGSDEEESEEEEEARRSSLGDPKAGAVALPSASDLMAGGTGGTGAGIYHNPYEQQEIHTKRKLGDNDDNTIFKKVQGKKKVYGQGQKPKTNSSVARSWYALPFRFQPRLALA